MTGPRSLSFRTGSLDTPRLLAFLPTDGERVPTLSLRLELTFDRPMDQASVAGAATLAPEPEGGLLWTWNEARTAAVVTSRGTLTAGTLYQFTLSGAARDAQGVALGQDIRRSFTTEPAPTVVLAGLIPADGATDVASTVVIRIPFSKPMDPGTTEQACLLLLDGQPVTTTRQWDGPTRLLLTPASPLRPGQVYTVLIGRSARDQAGMPLAAAATTRFTTRVERSVAVTAVAPASGASEVDPAVSLVAASSEPMDPTTVRLLLQPDPGQRPEPAWTDEGRRLTLTFPLELAPGTAWAWTIAPEARSQSGHLVIPPGSFTFTTAARPNARVTATVPAPGQTEVDPREGLRLTFDQDMDRTSISSAFRCTPAPEDAPTFTWTTDRSVTITFATPLPYGTACTLTLDTGARSTAGLPLTTGFTLPFTTIARPAVMVAQVVPAAGATDVTPTTVLTLPFSRLMNQASVQAALTVTADGSPLEVGATWEGTTLRLRPAGGWPPGKTIGLALAGTATDLAGHPLGSAFATSFTTSPPELPAVTAITPANGATDIPLDRPVVIVFSKAMASPTVDVVVSPAPGGTVVRQWSADGKTLTLTVPEGWAGSTVYGVTVAATSRDTSGLALGSAFTSGFTTVAPPVGPRLISFLPSAGSTDVPIRSRLELRFDTPMATPTVQSAFALTPAPPESPIWSWSADRTIATLTWSQGLAFGQSYTARLAATARSQSGLTLALPFESTFVTEVVPSISAVEPAAGARDVATDSPVVVTFAKEMDRASVEQAFTLLAGSTSLTGTFSWAGTRLTFRATGGLPASTTLTVTIAPTARDTRGNLLPARFSSTFTTVPPPPCRLTGTTPSDGQTGVSVTTPLVLDFSTPMARATVDVLIDPPPAGGKTLTWSNGDTRLTVTFGGTLVGGQRHQITLAPDTRDVFGSSLTGPTGFSFVTQTVTTPVITSCFPVPGTLEAPVTSVLQFTFDRPMDRATTQAAFTLTPSAGIPQFAWSTDQRTLSVAFADPLAFATLYEATISATARDSHGIALGQAFVTGFRTETQPAIVAGSEYPVPGSEGLPTDTSIRVAFTKAMDRSATEGAVRVQTPTGTTVGGTFSWTDERTLEFRPALPLAMAQRYRVTVTTAARDLRGNALAAPVSWEFTTRGLEGANWRRDLADDPHGNQFSPRKNHVVVSFLDYLWVIGGNDGQFRNDVWRSTDGVTWTRVLADDPAAARFSPRAGHACLVFDNKLWLIGGETETATGYDTLDDVWWTANGTDWTRATAAADFWARAYHSAVVFGNRMWLLGGMTYDSEGMPQLLDDAWTSTDGQTWTEVAATVSFLPRMRSTAAVFGGRLWVFGGYGTDALGSEGPLADAWYTTNGQTWIRAAEQAGFPARAGAALFMYQNRLWLVGGSGRDESGWDIPYNDVWATSDGQTWSRVLDNAPAGAQRFEARADGGAAVHRSRMVLIGGETEWGIANDVWSTD
jgi:N-acetylneuraminic acid mutarotase